MFVWSWAGTLIAAPVFQSPPVIQANPNPAAPLAAVLRFSVNHPVRATVAVTDGRHSGELRFDEKSTPERGLPIVGMRPGTKHQLRVLIRDANGARAESAPLEFTTPTPPLPAEVAEFPQLRVRRFRPEKVEPGFTLFNPRRSKKGDISLGANYGMLIAVDDEGIPVWFYRTDSRIMRW